MGERLSPTASNQIGKLSAKEFSDLVAAQTKRRAHAVLVNTMTKCLERVPVDQERVSVEIKRRICPFLSDCFASTAVSAPMARTHACQPAWLYRSMQITTFAQGFAQT